MSDVSSPDQSDPPGTPEAKRIHEELEKAASLMTGARRLMSEGRTVDLSALEERIKAIHTAVSEAPQGVAQYYAEHLSALMDILDALEQDLEEQRRATEEGLSGIKRRAAQDAYGPKDKG